jgi:hypothetical protein
MVLLPALVGYKLFAVSGSGACKFEKPLRRQKKFSDADALNRESAQDPDVERVALGASVLSGI